MKYFRQGRSAINRYRPNLVAALCFTYASLSLPHNSTTLSWYPAGQGDSAPEQKPALTGSGYGNEPFDQKPGPGRGFFPDFSSVEMLELFRPLLTVQERVFQKIFTPGKAFPEAEKSTWLPAVRSLLIGWRERTHYHTGSPDFTQQEEMVANTHNEIVIIELPVSPDKSSKAEKMNGAEPEPAGKDPGATRSAHQLPGINRKQENEDDQPPEDAPAHNCAGSNCPACDFEPCHCIKCRSRAQPLTFDAPSEKQETAGLATVPAGSVLESNNIVSLLARRRRTGLGITENELTECSHSRLEQTASPGRNLYVENMNVLGALPDGTLIVLSRRDTDELTPPPIRALGQMKYWKTIEVSLPKYPKFTDVMVIDSNHFIIETCLFYTYYSKQGHFWQSVKLGEFSSLSLLNDGRFVTTPARSPATNQLQGNFHIWLDDNGQLVPTPLENVSENLAVFDRTNRIMTFQKDGRVKIWEEKHGLWTAELFPKSRLNADSVFELEDGRIVSLSPSLEIPDPPDPPTQSLGIWQQTSGNWFYSELQKGLALKLNLVVLEGSRFIIFWHHNSLTHIKSTSIQLWSEQEGKWDGTSLDHRHEYRVKGVLPISKGRFITWSYDSAKVWTCEESCSYVELTGVNKIWEFRLLSDRRLVTRAINGELTIWYEHNSLWCYRSFGPVPGVRKFVTKPFALPQGYLAATYATLLGTVFMLPDSDTRFWDLFPGAVRPGKSPEPEHFQRVEDDRAIEYIPQ